MTHRVTLGIVLLMVISACGDDSSGPATTTTATATTSITAAPTTTTAEATPGFTAGDLPTAVLMDGDPWVAPIGGVMQFPLTIDDVWPAEAFPEERPIYEAAGFLEGSFAAFIEDEALVITAAHLFADSPGASAAFDLIESSFQDTELVALITDLEPGALDSVELLDADFGDRSSAVRVSGPEFQVVGVIWVTDNLLQFVRVGMVAGDDAREQAAFDLAAAIAARTEG
jgi:hypothetical protein